MKILAVLLAVLLIAPACLADTLRHLLVNQGIPLSSFQESELQENVEELMVSDAKSTVLTYWVLKDKQLPSPLSFVIYDRPSGLVLRKDLQLSESNDCGRQPDGISFIEEFIVLSSSLTPSAECLQLFDKKLQLHSTLYGFGPVLVAPGQIVMIENMIHFAPVHPERLQLVDLHFRCYSRTLSAKERSGARAFGRRTCETHAIKRTMHEHERSMRSPSFRRKY